MYVFCMLYVLDINQVFLCPNFVVCINPACYHHALFAFLQISLALMSAIYLSDSCLSLRSFGCVKAHNLNLELKNLFNMGVICPR